jgi:hypothetical protein
MVIGYFNACEIETKHKKKGVTSMSLQKNGASLTGTINKAVAFGAALLTLTGSVGSLSAAYDPYCPPENYCPAPGWDPCACEMPDFVLYADFLYWQIHTEGLEFARNGGFSDGPTVAIENTGEIVTTDCDFEPGFRVGLIVDLGCCNWDFYAQYTYLSACFSEEVTGDAATTDIQPLIWNQGIGQNQFITVNGEFFQLPSLTLARGEWDSCQNVLDFGLGRTFSVNNCFDMRPHIGFKATWQELKYNVRYERPALVVDINGTPTQIAESAAVDIRNKTDFDGIGLRGGLDAKWRFSPCLSLVGGFAVSAVWSDIEIHRHDTFTSAGEEDNNVDVKRKNCALIPVTELLLGLQYDATLCDFDFFVFVGWENQVWWNLNRNLYVENSTLFSRFLDPANPQVVGTNDYQFGPSGNLTNQGLTVRAGFAF